MRGSRTRPFRGDVEGLRGVAILLVVLFHGTSLVPAGFVGVDVFFVISGFLITGMLLDELEATGGLDLLGFYDRRVRRLLPAATALLVVVMPLAYLALAPLDRPVAMTDGASAAMFVSNIRFAMLQGDYFTAVTTPSPFIHFWSLSLEEQFYLVWPFLLLVVARGRHPRIAAGSALLALMGASLVACVVLTDQAATWGFYSLPARAWQFAAGGLLAAAATPLSRIPRGAVLVAGWAGATLLFVALLTIDGSVAYPGLAALLPTAAATLLILAGDRAGGPGAILRTAPLRFLGRISYSLYLWHWPLLVLPAAAMGAALAPPVAAAMMVIAVVVAWASWAFVEERFRKHRGPRDERGWRSHRAVPLGAAAVVGVVAWASLLGLTAGTWIWDGGASGVAGVEDGGPGTSGDDGGPVTPGPSEAPTAEPVPSASAPPTTGLPSPTPTPRATPTPQPAPTPIPWTAIPAVSLPDGVQLPSDVKPALSKARKDEERLMRDGCFTSLDGTQPAECVYGKAAGKVVVALIGDSHASEWFPALDALANRHGWRLLPFVKASCPFVDMPVLQLVAKREYRECAVWRAAAIRAINNAHPDLVIVATAHRGVFPMAHDQANVKAEGAAMARAIEMVKAPVAVLVDNPRTDVDIPACLSSHATDIHQCAIPRSVAFPPEFGQLERIAATASGATLVDIISSICPSTPCPVVRNKMILYRDGHHLTATFVRSLANTFDDALRPLLPPDPAPTPAPSSAPTPAPTAAFGGLVDGAAIQASLTGPGGAVEPIVAHAPG